MPTLAHRVRRVVPVIRAGCLVLTRPLVVLLHPTTATSPAELEIRELGRRKGPRISIARLYTMLHRQAAGLPAPQGRRSRRVR